VTDHDCPGADVDKNDMIMRIRIMRIRQQMGGDHPLGGVPIS
jgi:hypothetical protein